MYLWLIIFFVVLFIISIAGTLYAYRLEEKKMEKYEQEGNSPKDELERSHAYETRSLQTSMKIQIWYYFILVVVMTIGLVIFVRFYL